MTAQQETKIEMARRFMSACEEYRAEREEYERHKRLALEAHGSNEAREGSEKSRAVHHGQYAALYAESVWRIFLAYREQTRQTPEDARRDLQAVCDWIAERGREYEAAHPLPTTREELATFVAGLAAKVAAAWNGRPDGRADERAQYYGFITAPDVRETYNAALDFWQTWRGNWTSHHAVGGD